MSLDGGGVYHNENIALLYSVTAAGKQLVVGLIRPFFIQ